MAIKGKGRTKTKRVARAPRREPVAVKPPFFHRRWVQVLGAALGGAAIVLIGVWVARGLHKDQADTQSRNQARTKLAAAQAWKGTVEQALQKVSTPSKTGAPPSVLLQLDSAFAALGKPGPAPKKLAQALRAAESLATSASDTLRGFDVSGAVANKGFVAVEVNSFLDSQQQMAEAMQLYAQAAKVAESAAVASGAQRTTLVRTASGIRDEAAKLFQSGWSVYQQALYAGGIQALGPAGLPGATGSAP